MYDLMQEVIRETDYKNIDKLKTLIIGVSNIFLLFSILSSVYKQTINNHIFIQESTGLINSLAQSGHSYAMMHANASLTRGQVN